MRIRKPKPLGDLLEWNAFGWMAVNENRLANEMTFGRTRDSIENGTLKVKEMLYLRHAMVLFLIKL